MLKKNKIWVFCLIAMVVTACSISYKFNGASIDYTKIKTITIIGSAYKNSFMPFRFFLTVLLSVSEIYGGSKGYLYSSDPSSISQ